MQHVLPVTLFTIFGWWLIHRGKRGTPTFKWRAPFLFSLLLPITILLWIILRLMRGEFDVKDDLPLHMCNFVTFFVPFIFKPNRYSKLIFGVTYFWVLSGTLQAVITPGLEQAFPHFWYLRYWLIHCGLVILVLYAAIVLKFRPTWKDFWNAIIAMNVLFVMAYAFNLWADSNYLYTMHKPQAATLLDYFGRWPWYILASEFVAAGFFLLYFLPFIIKRGSSHHKDKILKES